MKSGKKTLELMAARGGNARESWMTDPEDKISKAARKKVELVPRSPETTKDEELTGIIVNPKK